MTRWKPRFRIAALLALGIALFVVATTTDIAQVVTAENVRGLASSAGLFGTLLFLGAFTAGNLLHVPGMPFVFAGVLGYGGFRGGLLALVGAVLAVTVTFLVVRLVGGQPLADVKRPLLKRLLGSLEHRPVRTVVALRTLFQMSPPLNYTLAMSGVRFRDYFVGSIAGLALPVLAVALFVEFLT